MLLGSKSKYKMKYRTIYEAIEYSPEKIDSFVTKATKDLSDLKRVFAALVARIGDLTIIDIQEDSGKAQDLLKKVQSAKQYAEKSYNTYYEIVDMYDYLNSPKNVSQLDSLASDLDYLLMDIKALEDALNSLIDAAKDFNRFTTKIEL